MVNIIPEDAEASDLNVKASDGVRLELNMLLALCCPSLVVREIKSGFADSFLTNLNNPRFISEILQLNETPAMFCR